MRCPQDRRISKASSFGMLDLLMRNPSVRVKVMQPVFLHHRGSKRYIMHLRSLKNDSFLLGQFPAQRDEPDRLPRVNMALNGIPFCQFPDADLLR